LDLGRKAAQRVSGVEQTQQSAGFYASIHADNELLMAAIVKALISLHAAWDVGDGLLLPTVVAECRDGIGVTAPSFDVLADDLPEALAPTVPELDVLVTSLYRGQVLCRLHTTSAMGALTPQLPKIGRLVTQLGNKFIA